MENKITGMTSRIEAREEAVGKREKKAKENEVRSEQELKDADAILYRAKQKEASIDKAISDGVEERTYNIKDELQKAFDTKIKEWHIVHDIKFYGMLMFLILFCTAHAVIYNESYTEHLGSVLAVIKNIFVSIGKCIWIFASTIGKIGNLIPDETASNIVSCLVTIVVIIGIAYLIIRFLFYKLFGKLLKYWQKIKLWDSITLQVAAILVGVATIVPASFNIIGVSLLVFIGYIVLRSFLSMDDYETKRSIMQGVVTALIIFAVTVSGTVYFVWFFANLFE